MGEGQAVDTNTRATVMVEAILRARRYVDVALPILVAPQNPKEARELDDLLNLRQISFRMTLKEELKGDYR